MLPQRQSGESATFLVKRLMFSALQLVCKRVGVKNCGSRLPVFQFNCVMGLFSSFSIGA